MKAYLTTLTISIALVSVAGSTLMNSVINRETAEKLNSIETRVERLERELGVR